jgi:hypothetical protein
MSRFAVVYPSIGPKRFTARFKALRNTSGRITAEPTLSQTPPPLRRGRRSTSFLKSISEARPRAAPLWPGCMAMISAPMAGKTHRGTDAASAAAQMLDSRWGRARRLM